MYDLVIQKERQSFAWIKRTFFINSGSHHFETWYNNGHMGEMKVKKVLSMMLASLMCIGNLSTVSAAQKLPKTLSQKEINEAIAKTRNYQGKEHVYVGIGGHVQVTNEKQKGTVTWLSSNDKAIVKTNKKGAMVTGVKKGSVRLSQVFYKKGKEEKKHNNDFENKEKLAFHYTSLSLNLGDQVTIQTNKQAKLTNSHSDVARLNEKGTLTAVKPGTSVITATYKHVVGDTADQKEVTETARLKVTVTSKIIKTKTMKATVSDPQIAEKIIYCVPNNFEIEKLPIKGVSKQSRKRIYVDTQGVNEKAKYPAIASLQGKIITKASDQGKVRIRYAVNAPCKIYVDGLVLKRRMIISKLKFDNLEKTILLANQKSHFSMSGMSGQTPVTMTPHNTSAVTMNDHHQVTAHHLGKMDMTIKGDGLTYTRQYWCVNKRTYKLVHDAYALARTKPRFSLGRTGSTIDCSTFIWRTYKKNGINFGSNSAPVAANIAKYCQAHGRLFKAPKTIDALRPGDIMFISSHKNGRFKNITHVEMYISSGTDLGARGPSTAPYLKKAYGSVVEGDAITDNLVAVGRLKL